MNKLLVSVIIPAFNESKVIERNLKSLIRQTYKDIEIIVVDDSSKDNTPVLAKKYTKNVFIRKHAERSVQRNFGASKARGKYLLFLDADMELLPNVVEECVKMATNNKKIGAIAIPEKSVATTYWEKVKAFERSFYDHEGGDLTDAARFFKADAFRKVGGYDEKITGPEDWDLPDRVVPSGYKIGRINSFILHYERVGNPFSVAKKKYYYALKSHRYFEKNKVSVLGPKTIYFLRPVFYTNWKIILFNPILSISMIFMLTLEQFAGGIGYLVGKIKRL
jgi:glycosyltransferase involved in cell wall biosynthesis